MGLGELGSGSLRGPEQTGTGVGREQRKRRMARPGRGAWHSVFSIQALCPE